MNSITKLLLLSATFFSLTSCGADDLPEYVDLGSLRILALQVGTDGGAAEFNEGANVQVRPFISDYGNSRTVSFEAVWCTDPGISYGAEPTCDGVPGAQSLGTGAITFGDATRTGLASPLPGSFTIPTGALALRNPVDQYNGISYLFTYKLTASDGASVQSFKRVIVSSGAKTAKNNNPAVAAILANGSPLSAWPSGEVQLKASFGGGAQEVYQAMKRDGSLQSRTEELLTTWFISTGEVNLFRTINDQETKYTPSGATPPAGPPPVIVAVTRDERGGVAVRVQPIP